VLHALHGKYNDNGFTSGALASLINDRGTAFASEGDRELGEMLLQFLYPNLRSRANQTSSPISVGMQLKRYIDAPVLAGVETLILRRAPTSRGGGGNPAATFFVEVRR
jgi:hypothetical protein